MYGYKFSDTLRGRNFTCLFLISLPTPFTVLVIFKQIGHVFLAFISKHVLSLKFCCEIMQNIHHVEDKKSNTHPQEKIRYHGNTKK